MKRDDECNPTLYLAASALEIERAKRWRAASREAGIGVVASWIENVERVGESNPRNATKQQRLTWSTQNIREMQDASVIWFLVPAVTAPTRGGWYEAGFGYCAAQRLVFSGDTLQSIYCATGLEFDTDEDAFTAILGMLDVRR